MSFQENSPLKLRLNDKNNLLCANLVNSSKARCFYKSCIQEKKSTLFLDLSVQTKDGSGDITTLSFLECKIALSSQCCLGARNRCK